ncbi:MAG: DUF4199 domain-containing protein [Flavobacteriaceae bacterium]|jgi:hypothetical protein|nr:DUF4199 domain-containing protein [Flavobacteriaceae bacterium]
MKKFSIEFKWAALATLAALIWMIIEKSLGFHDEKIRYEIGFAMLFNLILIIFYWLNIREKKQVYYEGIITWQKAFISGLVLTVMISFFYPLIQYIGYNQLTPGFMQHLQEALITEGKMTLEDAQKNASFDLFMRNAVFNNLSFGVVYSAIIAYFMQTKGAALQANKINKPEMVKVKKNKKSKR